MLLLLLIACAIAFKLYLFKGLSIGIDAMSPHDDLLHIRLANSILQGSWLGKFNNLTLAKGPFYPLFIALSHNLGIPLLILQQLLYAIACIIAALPLGFIAKKYQRGVFIFSLLILLFNPFSFDGNLNLRVNRPALYQSLSLLTISCYLNSLVFTGERRWKYIQLLFLFLGGVFFSFAWATREESLWLLAPILLICIYILYTSFKKNQFVFSFIGILLSTVSFFIFLAPILLLNKSYYGHFIITEFQHPAFIKAYGSLTRVKSDYFLPYVPVPRNVRTKIAQVSPKFASINVFLEGDIGSGWATVTKNEAPLENNEFDIGGGWFMWAFRDAVSAAGHYNSLTDALSFYEQLAEEVNTACSRKELNCVKERNTFIPVWNNQYFSNILLNSKLLLKNIFFFTDVWPHYEERKEPSTNYLLFQKVTLEKPHTFSDSDIKVHIIFLLKQLYKLLLFPAFFISTIFFINQIIKCKAYFLFSREIIFILSTCLGIIGLGTILVLLGAVSYPPAINSGYFGPIPPLLYITIISLFITAYNLRTN